jgi:hypothetical protein
MVQREKEKTNDGNKVTTTKGLTRPNIYTIKAILECIREFEKLQNYSDILVFCHATKNRRDLALYLKLLLDLKWICVSSYYGMTLFIPGRCYELTSKGRSFLRLFSEDRDGDEEKDIQGEK